MSMNKFDKRGRQHYIKNIPLKHYWGNRARTINGKLYEVKAMNGENDSCWYNNRFLGDDYAVFVFVFTGDGGFWQQVSKWYRYYGNAVRYMNNIKG